MNNMSIPEKDELERLYASGYSMKEIGVQLNMAVGKIHKYFGIYGIKPREPINEITKEKISQANKGNTYRKGHKASEVTKRRLSEAKSQRGIGHKKKRCDGYIAIYFPDHPKSTSDGFIMEHVLMMECFIGRWIKDDEVVHHKNKIRDDNRIENLQLLTKSEHARLHALERHNKNKKLKKGVMTYQ